MNQDDVVLRNEQVADFHTVEELTREAFWNLHSPGCDEHYLVHIMRESSSFVSELDVVAVYNDRIIGNVMYTKACIAGDDGTHHPVLSFGPISVLPEYQGRGVGSKLIEYSKNIATELGYKAILIFGDPEFYQKVGFIQAEHYSIGTSWNTYATPLLACELVDGALNGCSGRFYEDDIYNMDKDKADAFDMNFPPKEKLSGLPTQIRFAELVTMNKPRL